MLNRQAVREFLKRELEGVKIPKDISFDKLVEAFCQYSEDDYYEWLKDNFRSFFEFRDGELDWSWIREKIEKYKTEKRQGRPIHKSQLG